MNRRQKDTELCIIILFLLFVFAGSPSGLADEKSENEAKLKIINRKIQKITLQLEQEQSSKDTLQAQLKDLEKALSHAQREIRNLDQNIQSQNSHLNRLQTQRQQLFGEFKIQKALLGNQIRAAYQTGHQEQVKLLLNQTDPTALSRVLSYYDYFNKARLKLMANIHKTLDELEIIEKQIRFETRALEALTAQKKQSVDRLMGDKQKRAQLLVEINQRIQQESSEVQHLKADESRIRRLLQSLGNLLSDIPDNAGFNRAFSNLKGRLMWPTSGKITHHFGERRTGGSLLWQGITISTKPGQEIRAVSGGRVAFADWLQGFGLILIIDHRDGYMSLYAHNESLFKETGDWVEQGELIGKAGNTGGLSENMLYLEIRHQGIPLDPRQWLKPLG